jgi:hypothetical protein
LSAQTWDATSFRYLAFLVIGCGVGLGLWVDRVHRWDRRAGFLVIGAFALIQGSVLAYRFKDLPPEFPAVRIARNLEGLGFRTAFANHWAGEAARYLHGGRVHLIDHPRLIQGEEFPSGILEPRVGLVVVGGLDDPGAVRFAGDRLKGMGYRFVKEWPMEHSWAILEFRRPGTPGAKVD